MEAGKHIPTDTLPSLYRIMKELQLIGLLKNEYCFK